jgi:hypothetical protein
MSCPSLISAALDNTDPPSGEEAMKTAFGEPGMRLLEEQRLAARGARLDFGTVRLFDSIAGKDGGLLVHRYSFTGRGR